LIIKDSEIGKLYAVVNDQSAEISELTSRLDKLRQDTEYDSYKNSKEIDHWKRQLTMLKKSKQEELQQRMAELENYHNEQSEQLE
jgi:predicted RNase H-like nuclease (RuvC/YqgF family)